MYKVIIFILLFCSIKLFSQQSVKYTEKLGQWHRIDTLSWFPEVLTVGTDDYFDWTAEGDPGSIYSQYGKWDVKGDTLILNCKLLLHDEYGNGRYLKKYTRRNYQKYIFLQDSDKLYLLGFYTIVNKKRTFIDYNNKNGKTLAENYHYFFDRVKFVNPKK
jgi:hypothetical protein